MKSLVIAMLVATLGACAGDLGVPPGDDQCDVSLSYSPLDPIAGPMTEVRVDSTLSHAPGTHAFTWHVMKSGTIVPFTDALSDHSAISFLAETSGTYDVTLDVSASGGSF